MTQKKIRKPTLPDDLCQYLAAAWTEDLKANRAHPLSKVPVSRDAVIKRVNRKLAPDGQRLRSSRGSPAKLDNPGGLGHHYTVDLHSGGVEATHVDIEVLARDLEVIGQREVIADV